MKLILAIVNDEDSGKVLNALGKNGYSVTKLATTGGFLRTGNTTMLIGTEEEKVQNVIDIIKEKSHRRTQIATSPIPIGGTSSYTPYPMEVEVGGATVFVLNVEKFEKL